MSKEDLIELQGVVTEVLAGGNYKVKCGENHEVLARLNGKMRQYRIRVIAGDRVTARTLASTMTDLTGTQFRLLYAGSVGSLTAMSRAVRAIMPASTEPFPPWQGMQYFASMFSGEDRKSVV